MSDAFNAHKERLDAARACLENMGRLELIALGKKMNNSGTFGKNYTKMSKDAIVSYMLRTKTLLALEASLAITTAHTSLSQPAPAQGGHPLTITELVGRLTYPQLEAVSRAFHKEFYGRTYAFENLGYSPQAFTEALRDRATNDKRRIFLANLATDMLAGKWPTGFGPGPGGEGPGKDDERGDEQGAQQSQSQAAQGDGDEQGDGDGDGDGDEQSDEQKAEQQKQDEAAADEQAKKAMEALGPVMTSAVVQIANALDVMERRNYPKHASNGGAALSTTATPQQAPSATYELTQLDNRLFPLLLALRALPSDERKYGVIMVGKAGSGKTYAAEQVFQRGGEEYGLMPCSGGATEAVLLGRTVVGEGLKMNFSPSLMVERYENGGGIIADEIDGLEPNAGNAWNALTANGRIDIADRRLNGQPTTILRHKDFWCIGTANTYGDGPDAQYVGRFQMDAASRDRWIILQWPENDNLRRHVLGQPLKHVNFWKPTRTQETLPADFAALFAWCTAVEAAAEKHGLLRVVGVRLFQKARMLRLVGCNIGEIKTILLAGWQDDERTLLGEAGKVSANA